MENTLDSLTVKEVAGILRCSKAHALNVIEGRVRGLPKLPRIWASALRRCIFGLSESRFPISA
jgi:hypothetical protein